MFEDELRDGEWIDSKELTRPPKTSREPKFDVEVSKIVGKPVRMNDPRLIALLVKWKKRNKSEDVPDNHLRNPQFLVELKKTFNGEF